jgi:hypothetical protein
MLKTFNAALLNDDDLHRLCGPRDLNSSILNESVCRSMIALRAKLLRSGTIMITFGTMFAVSEERLKIIGRVYATSG